MSAITLLGTPVEMYRYGTQVSRVKNRNSTRNLSLFSAISVISVNFSVLGDWILLFLRLGFNSLPLLASILQSPGHQCLRGKWVRWNHGVHGACPPDRIPSTMRPLVTF